MQCNDSIYTILYIDSILSCHIYIYMYILMSIVHNYFTQRMLRLYVQFITHAGRFLVKHTGNKHHQVYAQHKNIQL